MDEKALLARITYNLRIFGGMPIIRGHRLALEHVLGMLAAGDTTEMVLAGYPWLERADVLACLASGARVVGHERVDVASDTVAAAPTPAPHAPAPPSPPGGAASSSRAGGRHSR